MFGFAWALAFHLLNGIRHLSWDIGYGFNPKSANALSVVIYGLSIVIAAGVFVVRSCPAMGADAMSLETPIHRVEGLGAAHSGTQHFWRQRITAVALIPFPIWFGFSAISLIGAAGSSGAELFPASGGTPD